ncbi:hypothetical protein EV424DRAFT_445347 [Suillus variegatus]|nr:hypothetical protein EV424DRAFT_445347 [Suillus variegatus]
MLRLCCLSIWLKLELLAKIITFFPWEGFPDACSLSEEDQRESESKPMSSTTSRSQCDAPVELFYTPVVKTRQ